MSFLNQKRAFWNSAFAILFAMLAITGVSLFYLLNSAITEKQQSLLNQSQVMSNLISNIENSIEKIEKQIPNSISAKEEAELEIISNIHKTFLTMGSDNNELEYLVGQLIAGKITFLAYSNLKPPDVLQSDKHLAVPMQKALIGQSGIIKESDYVGQTVFAAYGPIPHTPWGLVINQDYATFVAPYYKAAYLVLALMLLLFLVIFIINYRTSAQYQQEVEFSEGRFKQLVESAHDWIWEVDDKWRYTYVSPQVEHVLGYSVDEVLGKTPFELMPNTEAARLLKIVNEITSQALEIVNLENINIHKKGHEVILMSSGTPFFDSKGNLAGYRGMDKDITKIRKHESEISQLAFFDGLTGLANREQMLSRIQEELDFCLRTKANSLLLFMDLDGFKVINDSIGHEVGDKVLVIVAERLQSTLRSYDIAGRIGGDEFVTLLRCSSSDSHMMLNDIDEFLKRLLAEINKPMLVEGKELLVTASIGVASIPEDGNDVGQILRHADAAMYEAKRAGKNQHYFYHQDLQNEANKKLTLKNELASAFAKDEFELYYQRQTDIHGIKTTGLEALIRWNHPSKGCVSPGYFLPFIEEFNLNSALDDWVIKQVCHDIKYKLLPYMQTCSISLNLTPEAFNKVDLVERLTTQTKAYGVQPSQLTLEVTERTLVQDLDNAHDVISVLSELGFRIALDDFGTGYSSLSYLSKLSFDTIKIDRSFIKNLEMNVIDQNICKLIISLAKDLQKYIVAEGVENKRQVAFLESHNVDAVQGFIYSKPAPIAEVCEILRAD